MKREAYAAARTVSPAVHEYFARHLAQAVGQERLAPLPPRRPVEALIDAAFWASLLRVEGYVPRISLAWLAPEDAPDAMRFSGPCRWWPGLTRVAPAVERPGVHLGVWQDGGELYVWGTTRAIPRYCFVLEVTAPGLLVVKHHSGEEAGKFINVAVLEGDTIKMVDDHVPSQPECPALVTSLLGFASPAAWAHSVEPAGAIGGVDARARARRMPAGGAGGGRGVAGIDRAAARLRGPRHSPNSRNGARPRRKRMPRNWRARWNGSRG